MAKKSGEEKMLDMTLDDVIQKTSKNRGKGRGKSSKGSGRWSGTKKTSTPAKTTNRGEDAEPSASNERTEETERKLDMSLDEMMAEDGTKKASKSKGVVGDTKKSGNSSQSGQQWSGSGKSSGKASGKGRKGNNQDRKDSWGDSGWNQSGGHGNSQNWNWQAGNDWGAYKWKESWEESWDVGKQHANTQGYHNDPENDYCTGRRDGRGRIGADYDDEEYYYRAGGQEAVDDYRRRRQDPRGGGWDDDYADDYHERVARGHGRSHHQRGYGYDEYEEDDYHGRAHRAPSPLPPRRDVRHPVPSRRASPLPSSRPSRTERYDALSPPRDRYAGGVGYGASKRHRDHMDDVAPPPSKRAPTSGSRRIKVTNIPRDLDWRDIRDAFQAETGEILRCEMDKASIGTAWIEYRHHKDAAKAVETFDLGELNGRTITVILS